MPALSERAAACTTSGRRAVNQDAILLAELAAGAELIAIADGMGGHCAGEVASRRALEALHAALLTGDDLTTATGAANRAVFDEAATHPEWRGMGTTLVAILRQGGLYNLVNVGDSRAYRIDAGGIEQITRDNSFAAEAMASGRLTSMEIEQSPWRSAITRCVGTERELEVDRYGPYDLLEPHTLLLCTDGVHRVLDPEAMRRLVLDASGPESAAAAVVHAAYEAGSDDNISVAVVVFDTMRASASPAATFPLSVPGRDEASHPRPPQATRRIWLPALALLTAALMAIAYFARTLFAH